MTDETVTVTTMKHPLAILVETMPVEAQTKIRDLMDKLAEVREQRALKRATTMQTMTTVADVLPVRIRPEHMLIDALTRQLDFETKHPAAMPT